MEGDGSWEEGVMGWERGLPRGRGGGVGLGLALRGSALRGSREAGGSGGSREVRQAPQGPRSIWNPLLLAADVGAPQEGSDPITQTHTLVPCEGLRCRPQPLL